jgi:hypothetical protein
MRYPTPEIDPESGLPVLRGRISYSGPDCCQIAVPCPHCRCNHYHGWPDRTTDPGHLEHRICHCFDTPRRSRKKSPFHERGYLIAHSHSRKDKTP